MKYMLITNVPSPYRAKQYNEITSILNEDFFVIYTSNTFPNTQMKWERPILHHRHLFLNEYKNPIIPRIVKALLLFQSEHPRIIITAGFKPIMLVSFIYAKLLGIKHMVFTDSWSHSVNQLSVLHKIVRKFVFRFSDGFICVGAKGFRFLQEYGVDPTKIFISRLADSIPDSISNICSREYDLIFSGQLIAAKKPLFFAEVANEVKKTRPDTKVLIIGAGPLQTEMVSILDGYSVNYRFEGFVKPQIIKEVYSRAKILLFPTLNDAWGMVANDACSCGLPVITTPFAGVAGDLINDGVNGFILELDAKLWAMKIVSILENHEQLTNFSLNAFNCIKEFSIEKSASDFVHALTTTDSR